MQNQYSPQPPQPQPVIQQQPPRRRKFPKILLAFLLILFIVAGFLFARVWSLSSELFVKKTSFFKKISGIIFDNGLKGEMEGEIKILLLGYGGVGHDGTYLTDSVILATIKTDEKKILLQSIPRDYYWQQGQQKINFAYAAGLAKEKSHEAGGETALKAMEQVTGLEIPYFASVDFAGFEKAVDALGGVTVNVERAFVDQEYPNGEKNVDAPSCLAPDSPSSYSENCRYKELRFQVGTQNMSGLRALEFARSRHGNNGEGSDFARSKRQALVISAVKQKMSDLNILADASKINDILEILTDHAHTNLEPGELLRLSKIVKDGDYTVITENVDVENPLFCQKILEEVGYVILPCENVSSAEIKDYFQNATEYANVRAEQSSIILENASDKTELYDQMKAILTATGVTVYEVAYKGLPLKKSVLYTVTEKPATVQYIEKKLKIKAQPKPEQMKASSDLVLIIGE